MTTTTELFRAHAMAHGLSRGELKADPFLQFQDYFEAANQAARTGLVARPNTCGRTSL